MAAASMPKERDCGHGADMDSLILSQSVAVQEVSAW